MYATVSVPTRVPGDKGNLSIPCINTAGYVLRISVHNTAALQPEDIPKLNVKRLPLLMSTGGQNPQKWVKWYNEGVKVFISYTYLSDLRADESIAGEHTVRIELHGRRR